MVRRAVRGNATMPIVLTLLALMLALAFGVRLFVAGEPQRKSWYGAISIGRDKAVWLEFRGDRMRRAASPEALGKATWIPAERTSVEPGALTEEMLAYGYGGTESPEVALPLAGEKPYGWEKVEVTFSRWMWTTGDVAARGRFTRTDAQGAEWSYTIEALAMQELQESPKAVRPAALPGGGEWQMRLTVQPVWEGEEGAPKTPVLMAQVMVLCVSGLPEAEGGAGAWAGRTYRPVTDISRDGRPVRALLTVRDDRGKTIVRDVVLRDLHGGGTRAPVRAPDAKHSYVCEATLDAGPAAGTLRASKAVRAGAWPSPEKETPPTSTGFRGRMGGGMRGGRMRGRG